MCIRDSCLQAFDIGGERPVPAKSKVSFRLSTGFNAVPVEVSYVSVEVSRQKFDPFSVDGLQ